MTCENSAIKQEIFVIMTVEQILNGDMLYINNEKKKKRNILQMRASWKQGVTYRSFSFQK